MSNSGTKDITLPSLTKDELEALDDLDRSIKFHETLSENEDAEPKIEEDDFEDTCSELSDDNSLTFTVSQTYNQFKLPAIPESHETINDFTERKESRSDRKINAGYILFDGSEIKYVNYKTHGTIDRSARTTSVSSDKFSSIKSRTSSTTQTSDTIPINMYLSADELLGHEYLKNSTGFSITPYSRLPTNSHFSLREKVYFFLIGLACVISFNAIYISVAYFREILQDQVLSILGSCHYASLLVAMVMVFLGKKTWFQFIPTITTTFVLMAGVVAVFPILSVFRISPYPVYSTYVLVSLNGLCTGFSLAVTDKMVLLFPGGKSCLLFRLGGGLGCFLPAMIQLTAILINFKQKDTSALIERNTFHLYIVFPVAFLGIFLGFVSAIKLSRSGIYDLFADADNHKWDTIISSSTTVRRQRCKKITVLLLAEFLVAAVTWYSLSMAQIIHVKTITHDSSNKSPFWKMYLTTVLIGLFQFGDIIGSLLGSLSRYCCKSLPKMFLSGIHLLLAFLRIGCVTAVVYFIRSPFFVFNNIFVLGLYFVLAVTNGSLLVGMATQSLSLCELQKKDLCPVISQLTWLSIQTGCLVGVGLSFVPLS